MLSDLVNTLKYTNQRPSVAHIQVLKSAQRSCQVDLVGIDHEIRSLQTKMNQHLIQLKSLISTRVQKQANSELYAALASPIRLLPSEVLVRVFLYCLPESPGPNTAEAPLLLCHVCSLWRSIASAASQLWDALYINDGWGTPSSTKMLSLWFHNVGNHPLAFYYHKRSYGSSSYSKLDNLVPYSNQIRRLSYVGPTLRQLRALLELPSGSVGSLETLNLRSEVRHGNYDTEIKFRALRSAPRLREVFLDVDPQILCFGSQFTLPWAQLTDLDITSFLSWQDWCRIFLACKSLKTGKFYVGFDDGEPVSPPVNIPQAVIQHDLVQLKISSDGGGDASLFDAFQFPALNAFSLSGRDGYPLFSLTEGSRLSSQITGGSLSQLYLGSLLLETDDLLQILRRLPSLKQLGVDLDVDHRQLCQFLTISGHVEAMTPVYLPQLAHLALCIRLQAAHLDGIFSAQDFYEMVLSRRRHSNHIACLVTVILQICTGEAVDFAVQILKSIESCLSEEIVNEYSPPLDALHLDARWGGVREAPFRLDASHGFR